MMTHLNDEEIFELTVRVSSGEQFEGDSIEALRHIKACPECYEKFCVAAMLCDATSEEGIEVVTELRRAEALPLPELKEHISVIKVIRRRIKDVKTAVMEQINSLNASLTFEPALAMVARGDSRHNASMITKLEELDDEKTFVVFNASENELYIQLNSNLIPGKNTGIYLMFANNRIIEVPIVMQGEIIKGQINDVPDEDFRIYIETE